MRLVFFFMKVFVEKVSVQRYKVAADENWKSWDPPTVRVLNFHKIFRMKK